MRMSAECSNNHEGSELCNIASGHPINPTQSAQQHRSK